MSEDHNGPPRDDEPRPPVTAKDFFGNGRWRKEPLALVLATATFAIVFAIFKYGLSDDFHNCWDDCADIVPCSPYSRSFYRYSFVLTLYGSVGILPRIFGLWHAILFGPKRNADDNQGAPNVRNDHNQAPNVQGDDNPSCWTGEKAVWRWSQGWWQTLIFAAAQVAVTFFVNAGLKEGHTISFPLGLIGLPALFSLVFGGREGLVLYMPYIVFGILISALTSAIIWFFPTLHEAFGQLGFDVTLTLLKFVLVAIEMLFLSIVSKLEIALNKWTGSQLVWLAALLMVGIQSVSFGMLLNIQTPGLIVASLIFDCVIDIMGRLDLTQRAVYRVCWPDRGPPDVSRLEALYTGCKVLFDWVPVVAYVLMAAFNYSPTGGAEEFIPTQAPSCTSTPLLSKYQLGHTWPVVVGIVLAQTVADVVVYRGGHSLFKRDQDFRTELKERITDQEVELSKLQAGQAKEELTEKLNENRRRLGSVSPRAMQRRGSDLTSLYIGIKGRLVDFSSFANLFLLMLSSFFFSLLGVEGAGIVLTLIQKNQVTP